VRAFVRVLPLFAITALFAGCVTNDVVRGNPGAARYSALASLAPPAARKATRNAALVSPVQPAARTAARDWPDQALLARQPRPQCELSKPLADVPPDQAHSAMLDYEHQCYKQLAEIEHARLNALQDAAAGTIPLKPGEQALLERHPPPRCEPSEPPAGLSPAEAREATLDLQRQCYKRLEASERHELDALQDAIRKNVNRAHTSRGQVSRVGRE
jgi:hypothetical protein